MFKRKGDPEEHNYLYAGSGAAMLGALYAAHKCGVPHIYTMGYLASSILCIGSICGLASQPTARVGSALGNIGVAGGVITTICAMNFTNPVFY